MLKGILFRIRSVGRILAVAIVAGIGVATAVAFHGSTRTLSHAVATKTKLPSVEDVMTTKVYLNARNALEQEIKDGLAGTDIALDAFATHMSDACPHALKDAPEGSSIHHQSGGAVFRPAARELLIIEIETGLLLTLLRSQSTERYAFIKKVRSLEWNDHKVTNIIHTLVDTEAAWIKEAVPDVCHDIKIWTTSGYRKLPTDVQRIPFGIRPFPVGMTRELTAMGYGKRFPERDILQLLKNYWRSGSGLTSVSVEHLEINMAVKEAELLQKATRRIEKAMSLE